MTITVDLRPEVQAELARKAEARGVEIGAYAAGLLEDAAHLTSGPKRPGVASLESTLQEMAQFPPHIPSLPDEALSRERLYLDHD